MCSAPIQNDPSNPLASVIIFNYNYGRFLRQCLDSVFAQTYDNIEICFSDNASSDDSWEIALEYSRRFPDKMTITRNRKNFGSDANSENCFLNVRGKYFVQLCSDDVLAPECLERSVGALEAHPEAGFAVVHRTVIDEYGTTAEEPAFYKYSCKIPGAEQAAVYMMAAVNPSISQVIYNTRMALPKRVTGGLAARWYRTRILDFNMCCEYPMLYISEPLLFHRVHSRSDSARAAENLLEIIGPYVLQHQFSEIASQSDLWGVADRLPAALEKLGRLCVRYCVRFLIEDNPKCAKRYFHLAAAIFPEIADDDAFKQLRDYWKGNGCVRSEMRDQLKSRQDLASRSISYDPPPGASPLHIGQPRRSDGATSI